MRVSLIIFDTHIWVGEGLWENGLKGGSLTGKTRESFQGGQKFLLFAMHLRLYWRVTLLRRQVRGVEERAEKGQRFVKNRTTSSSDAEAVGLPNTVNHSCRNLTHILLSNHPSIHPSLHTSIPPSIHHTYIHTSIHPSIHTSIQPVSQPPTTDLPSQRLQTKSTTVSRPNINFH